jgi:hypothetical protein
VSKILVPSRGPADWQALLAEPEKHWAVGYSARTLAHCWEDAEGFPAEIKAALVAAEPLQRIQPLLILPEWQVALPGGARPSQNDVWVLAKSGGDLVSIAVEGKVNEAFGPTIREWQADASSGKETRLAFLQEILGLPRPPGPDIRYQLLHRCASAVLEAQRFNARHAVMLVHSFSSEDRWFDDFSEFVALFGRTCSVGTVTSAAAKDGMPLHLGWVRGDKRYMNR